MLLKAFAPCVLALGFGLACGEFVGGTESGNPINPVPPPEEPLAEPFEPEVEQSPEEGAGEPTVVNQPPEFPPQAEPPAPAPPASPPDAPENPVMVPAGGAACGAVACAAQAMAAAGRLSQQQATPGEFPEIACVERDGEAGCDCGPILRVSATSCGVTDRFGECLYLPEEFPGCGAALADGGAGSCVAVCQDVYERLATAALRTVNVHVRAHACVENQCRYVLVAEAVCYVAEPLMRAECSDLDDVLLRP